MYSGESTDEPASNLVRRRTQVTGCTLPDRISPNVFGRSFLALYPLRPREASARLPRSLRAPHLLSRSFSASVRRLRFLRPFRFAGLSDGKREAGKSK